MCNCGDADAFHELMNNASIADNTFYIPHPMTRPQADRWIKYYSDPSPKNGDTHWGIFQKAFPNSFLGMISLYDFNPNRTEAELGFWIGEPYWNRGYATEALAAVIEFAKNDLDLQHIFANHQLSNNASAAVLEKNGIKVTRTEEQMNPKTRQNEWVCYRKLTL
jgi:ribosomal-protein-alanine N-acetyltransferase